MLGCGVVACGTGRERLGAAVGTFLRELEDTTGYVKAGGLRWIALDCGARMNFPRDAEAGALVFDDILGT